MSRSKEFIVRSGELRHVLTVQTHSTTNDDYGTPIAGWVDKTPDLWGKVQPLSGKEVSDGDRIEGRTTHRIQIRSDFEISHSDRIKFGARFFNIESARLIGEVDKTFVIIAQEDLDV
jgi:SPP1 family predicted phage head-tail adaptor